MRARKPKNIDEKLQRYGARIASDPASMRGSWASLLPGCREVRIDLGCGKGSFTVASAQQEPDVLFVGIDVEEICVAMCARKACEAGVQNVVFAIAEADDLPQLFAPGELQRIYLNFSTPLPAAKHAEMRLTHAERLLAYRPLLAPGGTIAMKTDSQPLFDWSLAQFELAGYQLPWLTRDLHACADVPNVQSDFEQRLVELGAKIHALTAVPQEPCPSPGSIRQTQPASLVRWLPDDLESLTYIPYGMEGYVVNETNRRRRAAARAARAANR